MVIGTETLLFYLSPGRSAHMEISSHRSIWNCIKGLCIRKVENHCNSGSLLITEPHYEAELRLKCRLLEYQYELYCVWICCSVKSIYNILAMTEICWRTPHHYFQIVKTWEMLLVTRALSQSDTVNQEKPFFPCVELLTQGTDWY